MQLKTLVLTGIALGLLGCSKKDDPIVEIPPAAAPAFPGTFTVYNAPAYALLDTLQAAYRYSDLGYSQFIYGLHDEFGQAERPDRSVVRLQDLPGVEVHLTLDSLQRVTRMAASTNGILDSIYYSLDYSGPGISVARVRTNWADIVDVTDMFYLRRTGSGFVLDSIQDMYKITAPLRPILMMKSDWSGFLLDVLQVAPASVVAFVAIVVVAGVVGAGLAGAVGLAATTLWGLATGLGVATIMLSPTDPTTNIAVDDPPIPESSVEETEEEPAAGEEIGWPQPISSNSADLTPGYSLYFGAVSSSVPVVEETSDYSYTRILSNMVLQIKSIDLFPETSPMDGITVHLSSQETVSGTPPYGILPPTSITDIGVIYTASGPWSYGSGAAYSGMRILFTGVVVDGAQFIVNYLADYTPYGLHGEVIVNRSGGGMWPFLQVQMLDLKRI